MFTMQCIISQHNLGAWCIEIVFVSLGVSKYCESSSTVTFISTIFVVCGMDTGFVCMRSSVEYCIAVFGL